MQEIDGIRANALKGFRSRVAVRLAAVPDVSHSPLRDSIQRTRGEGKDLGNRHQVVAH